MNYIPARLIGLSLTGILCARPPSSRPERTLILRFVRAHGDSGPFEATFRRSFLVTQAYHASRACQLYFAVEVQVIEVTIGRAFCNDCIEDGDEPVLKEIPFAVGMVGP